MLGRIIFARRAHHNEALQTFIVVGVIHQYDEGTTYKVVPGWPTAFEAQEIFVASGACHASCAWEILGVLDKPEAVNDKITELNSLFIDSAIDWTPETVATVEDTIRLLEHSLQPPLDGEFGTDFCLGDDDEFDTVLDDELYTDDDELAEARAAGRAAAEAREQVGRETLERMRELLFQRQTQRRQDTIPVIIVEFPDGCSHEHVAKLLREKLALLGGAQ